MRIALLLTVLLVAHAAAADTCPERPPCRGCGCKGGTGYRAPDGHCVGFRELDATCGVPPGARCTVENAPGTGANRECALAPRRRKGDSPSPQS